MDPTQILTRYVVSALPPDLRSPHVDCPPPQIFAVSDFYENSALDMEDGEQTAAAEMLQRRRSSAVSRRRPSNALTQSQTSTPRRSTISLSQKSERPSGPSAIPLPRARLNSIVTRVDPTQTIASPLAQVFQPLVVDDDRDGEADQLSQDGVGGALVSYGPASRRRLSSMVRRPTAMVHGDFLGASAQAAMGIPRRSPGQATMTSPNARLGITGQALSTSPETRETTRSPEKERDARSVQGQGPSHLHEPLETAAEELEDQEEGAASPTDRRLEEIERRQQRIEELLERLVARGQ